MFEAFDTRSKIAMLVQHRSCRFDGNVRNVSRLADYGNGARGSNHGDDGGAVASFHLPTIFSTDGPGPNGPVYP